MKTLFVKNINFSISDEEIQILFSVFGNIISFKRPLDKRTKLKQGYCFIEMEDKHAENAINALNSIELGGRIITVELSNKSKKEESNSETAPISPSETLSRSNSSNRRKNRNPKPKNNSEAIDNNN